MTHSDLARAGELIREHVAVPSETSPAAERVRIMEALAGEPRGRMARRASLSASVALAGVVVALVLWLGRGEPALVSFTVGAEAAPGQVGAYVTPKEDRPLLLRFSEGSVISLEPQTRARVTQTSARGAVVLVEGGRAHVEVAHRPEADWRVLAGPYTIQVVGTSFDVEFDPGTETLEVDMRAGIVSVAGPGLAAPVKISGAARFVHSASTELPALAAEPTEPQASSPSAPALPASAAPAAKPEPAKSLGSGSAGAAAQAEAASDSWTVLASRGEYRRIVEAAEKQGVDSALATAGPGQLMALANAARFSGKSGMATRAYQAVRSRFPGTPGAASAAFLLGRMSEGGSPAAAITWYDRYVAEAPGGSFVAEALGRKMIALKRSGNVEAARSAAQDYLQRFPGGPYAGVAREMTTH